MPFLSLGFDIIELSIIQCEQLISKEIIMKKSINSEKARLFVLITTLAMFLIAAGAPAAIGGIGG
jgi:hypothetical protein